VRANGDTGVRDWIAGLDAATGKRLWQQFIIPAPGDPAAKPERQYNAWRTGAARGVGTGTTMPPHQTLWGTGNPVRCSIRSIGPATTSTLTA